MLIDGLFKSTAFFCLLDLLTTEREVLKSPTITVSVSISLVYFFYQFWLAFFNSLLFDGYTFRIVLSSWRIEPYIII